MAQPPTSQKSVNSNTNTPMLAATSVLTDPTTRASLAVLGGLSAATLLYKAYKHISAPHPSIPMAREMHPLLGHVPVLSKNASRLHDEIFSLISEHDIVAMKLPGHYKIHLNSPALCEWVFTTAFDKFHKGATQLPKFEALFGAYGQGIFVADGAHWRFHRKIGSRMFSVRNLRDYMFDCCQRTTQRTMQTLEKLRVSDQTIDINDLLGRMTFDCFTSIAFGNTFDSMSLYPKAHPFGVSFDALVELMPRRFREPFWKVKRTFGIGYEGEIAAHLKVVDEFTKKLITERRANAKQRLTDESGSKTFDLFSLYSEHKKDLTNDDIKFIALNFIIAGRDTTRMLLSWFLYDLSQHSDVKARVVAEIDAYRREHSSDVDYKSVTKSDSFRYLEAALCESLRFHPVVPQSAREAKEDITIPHHIAQRPDGGAYEIRKGDRVVIHQWTVAKLPSFYEDPLQYDPMRFLEKGVRTFSPSVYPFFNQAPRLCLGREFALMEAKIFVFALLSRYEFEVVPGQQVTYRPGAILNMKNGLNITLKPRQSVSV